MDVLDSNGQPLRDHGSRRSFGDVDIDFNADSHRATVMHLRLPKRPRRPHRSSSHSRKRSSEKSNVDSVSPVADAEPVFIPASLTPSEQIQLLLGDGEEGHTSQKIFCQMDVLHKLADAFQWRETARWVKYEEDVEEGGERWSKPHVASLSLHSLFELRSGLTSGGVILDMDAQNISQVADLLMDHLVNKKLLEESMRAEVRAAFIAPHAFQHNKYRSTRRQSTPDGVEMFGRRMSMKRTFSEIGRSLSIKRDSTTSLVRVRGNPNSQPNLEMLNGDIPESASSSKLNIDFMRKIPEGAEAANIWIGELDSLKYQVVAFIRLCEARNIGDLTEVPLPTRFIFFLLGPKGSQSKNVEIGRSISTIMVDEVFREVAYKAKTRQDVLAGVDEFLDQVTALPPGEWDPKIRIEPPQSVPSQEQRIAPPQPPGEEKEEEEEEAHGDPTLVRSGRLFGGLIADIKRKLPWYGSDFKDALHIQCVASIIFLYLATLTPNVTFGGLLGQATDQYMGTMECIFTASVVGVLFALFAGQPLNILGSTGPMLVLEMILYRFCKEYELDFLPFRCWIGIWTTAMLLFIVAFDLSALVRYITRFTEESFASLIAFIFIAEAFKKLFGILELAPINMNPGVPLDYNCTCIPPNSTMEDTNITLAALNGTSAMMMTTTEAATTTTMMVPAYNFTDNDTLGVDWLSVSRQTCKDLGGELFGSGCDTPLYKADVFFLSVILFFVTYIVASTLSGFKSSSFFPTYVRQTLSDFSVLIAILIAVGMDIAIGLPTPKLEVPEQFKPTRDDRGWMVNPWSDRNPWWLTIAASVPALLAVILIFMDQQITAVIVNRKENKLHKGNGYHLDLFVVAITILICSFLGLPWYVAATVSALAHIMSLKKESECTAPGERPTFLGVREQRVTGLMVGLLSGLSVLFTSVLKYIPMPVLYGVFLYMGMAALKGMQFIDRILLVFKPAKYQPDHSYLRHVPIKRVHIFTAIQVVCLAVLWVIKSVKSVSIIFPIMVLGTGFVRKAMDYIFTQRELKWLDDLMPDAAKKEKEDACKLRDELEKDEDEKEKQSLLGEESCDRLMEIKIQHDRLGEGKFGQRFTRRASLDTDRVNISEELTRTAMWTQLRQNQAKPPVVDDDQPHHHSRGEKRRRHKDRSNGVNANKSAAFYLQDDEDHEPKA